MLKGGTSNTIDSRLLLIMQEGIANTNAILPQRRPFFKMVDNKFNSSEWFIRRVAGGAAVSDPRSNSHGGETGPRVAPGLIRCAFAWFRHRRGGAQRKQCRGIYQPIPRPLTPRRTPWRVDCIIPEDTALWTDDGSTLGQPLRRWPSVKLPPGRSFLHAGQIGAGFSFLQTDKLRRLWGENRARKMFTSLMKEVYQPFNIHRMLKVNVSFNLYQAISFFGGE